MLLIIGSSLDDQPLLLARRWEEVGRDVAVVTPADLSSPGWRLRSHDRSLARAAVGRRLVPAAELEAVIGLLPWITAADLPHVIDEDRAYVAEEMGAFLLAWLHQLPCRVVDRPSTISLAGCGRSPHGWALLAREVGVRADPRWAGPSTTVTVVGRSPVGDVPAAISAAASRLAEAGGRSLVTFGFADGRPETDGPLLVGARVRAEVGSTPVADALLAWLATP